VKAAGKLWDIKGQTLIKEGLNICSFDFFRYECCTLCGECLYRCPYLDLDREEAVLEKRKLLEGKDSLVLKRCISCYACNLFCPNDCRPYELVTRKWFERYLREGLPARARYLMPTLKLNFRSDLVRGMNRREKELLEKWRKTPPEGELVLYPGCNSLALPHILDASFMKGVSISGSWDLCCGEMYYRMGLFDQVKRRAEELTDYYRDKKIGTMLFNCPACLNMFRNVLPDQFGARFNFRTAYLGTYLLEQIEAGSISPVKKLDKAVTVHDSCQGRVLGEEVMSANRGLLQQCGVEIVEMERSGKYGLCCGAAAGANRYNPFDILSAAVRALKEGAKSKKTGADELALYCGGCQLTLNVSRLVVPTRQPVRHVLEYVKDSCGENAVRPAGKRSLLMLSNILAKSFPGYLSRRRFWLTEKDV